jgi:hypothetical protein
MDPVRMLHILREYGHVECNSPKNQIKLYRLLHQQGYRWLSVIIGYTTGQGLNLNPYNGRARPGAARETKRRPLTRVMQYARWIVAKRLLWTDIDSEHLDFASDQDIFASAWHPNQSVQQVFQALCRGWPWSVGHKYDPINLARLKTPIKQIVLRPHLMSYFSEPSEYLPPHIWSVVADFLCTRNSPRFNDTSSCRPRS